MANSTEHCSSFKFRRQHPSLVEMKKETQEADASGRKTMQNVQYCSVLHFGYEILIAFLINDRWVFNKEAQRFCVWM